MKLIPIQIAISALVLSGAAFAQTAPMAPGATATPAAAPSPWAFNISGTTNYKFRGQDQDTHRSSMFKPALQGGVDYAFSNGFYLGNWNSTVDFAGFSHKQHLEVDLYGGYKWTAGDWGFDVGALQYLYRDHEINTTEIYFGTSIGPFSAKYSHTVSKGYFGTGYAANDGRGTGYLNFAFAKEVFPAFTLKAAVGQTMFRGDVNSTGVPDFTDYSIGGTYDLGNGLALSGFVQGASKKNSFVYTTSGGTSRSLNRNTLLFTLTKTL